MASINPELHPLIFIKKINDLRGLSISMVLLKPITDRKEDVQHVPNEKFVPFLGVINNRGADRFCAGFIRPGFSCKRKNSGPRVSNHSTTLRVFNLIFKKPKR